MPYAHPVFTASMVAILLAGAGIDLCTRRIPNALTLGAAFVGLAANVVVNRQDGALASVEGWSVGVLLLTLPLLNRYVGGGDVKLLAAAGAWGGPAFVFNMALYSAVVGGAMAICFLIAHGRLGETVRPLIFWFRVRLALVFAPVVPLALSPTRSDTTTDGATDRAQSRGRLSLPFGLALAIGGIAALVLG